MCNLLISYDNCPGIFLREYVFPALAHKQTEGRKLNFLVAYLRATIMVAGVIHQVSVMFHVSGIIQLTFMRSICILVFNIKTDTGVIQVAKIFTLVQVLDNLYIYCVVHQTLLSKKIVGWEIQFTISF